jgi:hypothetical protein
MSSHDASRSLIQIGPPVSQRELKQWKRQHFLFEPVVPPGTNIDALAAIIAAQGAFLVGPKAWIAGVRYARMLNPVFHAPATSGEVWLVMYQHDTPLPSAGSLPSPAKSTASTVAVIDAMTGDPLFKFQTIENSSGSAARQPPLRTLDSRSSP